MLAQRCLPQRLPIPSSESAKQGLRYERAVVKKLRERFSFLEHNPWFTYTDELGFVNFCSPDILIHEPGSPTAYIAEVKLTYTPEASKKLTEVYCPVVKLATGWDTAPLVIYRNATPKVNQCPHKSLQWLGGRHPLVWQ
jgi:hypothetical protein